MKSIITTIIFLFSFNSWSSFNQNVYPILQNMTNEEVSILNRNGFQLGGEYGYNSEMQRIQSGAICHVNATSNSLIFRNDILIRDSLSSLKKLPKQCLKNLLRNYIASKEFFDKEEIEAYCARSSVTECNRIKKVPNIYKVNVLELLDLIAAEKDTFRGCLQKPQLVEWNEINDLYHKVNQVEECRELKKGDVRVSDGRLGQLPQTYALERLNDKDYQVSFYVNFTNTRGGQTDPVAMKKRVDNCLEKANQNAQGPLGNKFKFKVFDLFDIGNVPAKKRPPLTNIQIGNFGDRSKFDRYASDIDCDTIVHELLHLTGLVDEYEERYFGHYVNPVTGLIVNNPTESTIADQRLFHKKIFNDCRAIPTRPSIMGNSNGFLDQVNPKPKVCGCRNDLDDITISCQKIMSGATPKAKELFVKSRNDLGNIIPGYSEYCQDNPTIGEKKDFFSSFDQLNNTEVIEGYLSFTNGRSFMDYVYHGGLEENIAATRVGKAKLCFCDPEKAKCTNFLAQLDGVVNGSLKVNRSTCPSGFQEVQSTEGALRLAKPDEILINHLKRDKPLHLLREAHVQRILYPGCNSVAPKYIACSALSYKELERDCPDRPDFCDDESKWLGR